MLALRTYFWSDFDALLHSSPRRALQNVDLRCQAVILKEFHCQGHKGHHKLSASLNFNGQQGEHVRRSEG